VYAGAAGSDARTVLVPRRLARGALAKSTRAAAVGAPVSYTPTSRSCRCRQAAYLLSHLMSAVEQLDAPWARAFLHRTRFLDGDFQGDVLAVISACRGSLAVRG
jgi:hypothetical protein